MDEKRSRLRGFFFFLGGGEGGYDLMFTYISTAVKRPKRFSFYLVGFYLILSGNMGKDV